MYMNKHKVFISYHHHLDQDYKDYLEELNEEHQIFINQSVKLGEIDDSLSTETIREKIRDEYLQDSSGGKMCKHHRSKIGAKNTS